MKEQVKMKEQVMKRKRWFLVILLCLSLGGVTGQYHVPAAKAERTVYVTATGSKYHTHKCGNGTYYPSSLSAAKARGLTACAKCFPNGGYSSSTSGRSSSGSTANRSTVRKKPVKISQTSKLLVKGQSAKLRLTGATGKVYWSSSKKAVAAVSANGKVTAKKKGRAVIHAKNGGITRNCIVTVEEPKLNTSNVTLAVSQSKILKLSGCRHSVRWSTSDSDVVKVSKGKLKAVDTGTATVKATVHGKGYACKVKVLKPAVEALTLSESNITMEYSTYKTIQISVLPKKALDYYDVSVTSSDNKVVSANADEDSMELISFEKSGTVDISVTVGDVTQKCQVTVELPKVTKLAFDQTELVLKPGESMMLSYDMMPYGFLSYYDVTCISSNTTVAAITLSKSSRYVYIKAGDAEGEADISLTVGNATATCHVKVARPEITSLTMGESMKRRYHFSGFYAESKRRRYIV